MGDGLMDEKLEDRIRLKAYQIWESEGRPHGRAEFHWDEAKEIVALEGVGEPTEPLTESVEPVIEPKEAFENQGEFPSLDDQGEGERGPTRDAQEARMPD